jgi:AraC-like DNA-binding protein
MSERTVLSSLARPLILATRARGVDARDLVSPAFQAQLDEVDGRVPYDALMSLCEALAERSGDPFFGLHVAEGFVDAATFGVVGFAARSCTTLGEAIARTVRYASVMNEHTEISLDRFSDVAVITDGPRAPLTWPRQYAEMAIASFLTLARRWTATPVTALTARFVHPAPLDTSEHARLFACPVSFGQPQNQLVLRASSLDAPFPSSDEPLREYFDRQAQAVARDLGVESDWLGKLRVELLRALPGGPPPLLQAARYVSMSGRTLQRRLAAEGLSYERLLDQLRRRAAIDAIGVAGTSIEEAGFMAGYVDLKAFRRAFRRWTGTTPQAYRRRVP